MAEYVILVDELDREIGVGEKMEVHRQGRLHRAFSVLIFNGRGELLLQKRARTKYHSGGLWTNTCCGHPRPGEAVVEAARRRLQEEMGFTCELEEAFTFIYRAELDHDLIEHEYDHVVVGWCDGVHPRPDPAEAEDWQWVALGRLHQEIAAHPERYTYWFKLLLGQLKPSLLERGRH